MCCIIIDVCHAARALLITPKIDQCITKKNWQMARDKYLVVTSGFCFWSNFHMSRGETYNIFVASSTVHIMLYVHYYSSQKQTTVYLKRIGKQPEMNLWWSPLDAASGLMFTHQGAKNIIALLHHHLCTSCYPCTTNHPKNRPLSY
jgi:hypothetical protein